MAPRAKVGNRYLPFSCIPSKDRYKRYLKYLREYAQPEDSVTVIGGGRGISTVVAAKQVRENGSVTVFEGSSYMMDLIQRVIELNGVSNRCDLKNAVVGPAINVYSDDETLENTHPAELETCDLLLLDCEGAEYDILDALQIQPNVIVVEAHPDKVTIPADVFMQNLLDCGYELSHAATYYGEEVSNERFRNLLERRQKEEPDIDGRKVKNPVAVLTNQGPSIES